MDQEADIMEEGHAMRLAMGRKASGAAEKISMPKPETSPKVNMVEGALMFIFALFVGDVLGSIPYLGVIFKIAAGGAISLLDAVGSHRTGNLIGPFASRRRRLTPFLCV